jgi:hypothetical protein
MNTTHDSTCRVPAPLPAPPAPHPAAIGMALLDRPPLAGAIATARRDGIDPVTFQRMLVDAGWPHSIALAAADRLSANESRSLTWWLWYGSLGSFVGLVAAAAHAALHAQNEGVMTTTTGTALAGALTLAFVAIPFVVWGRYLAKQAVEGAGRWSATRRVLVDLLMWCTGLVAVGRALVYLSHIFRGLFVPGVDSPTMWSLAQVVVTIAAAGGLFVFGWRERQHVRTGT